MGAKINTPKNPQSFKQNPKNPWTKNKNFNLKISHTKFPSHQNFQKALNDNNTCLCLFIHHTIWSKNLFHIWWSLSQHSRHSRTYSVTCFMNYCMLLNSRNYTAGIHRNCHKSSYCFSEYPKVSLLKSSYPKKNMPKFSYPKRS